MPTKCTITGTVVAPDGLPVALAQIEFGSAKVRPMTPLTIAPESATATTDDAGALTVELYPGEYSVRAMKTGRQRYPTFSITVPETASAVLADTIDLPPPVSLDAAGQAVLAAQAARDQAVAARVGIEDAEARADQSATESAGSAGAAAASAAAAAGAAGAVAGGAAAAAESAAAAAADRVMTGEDRTAVSADRSEVEALRAAVTADRAQTGEDRGAASASAAAALGSENAAAGSAGDAAGSATAAAASEEASAQRASEAAADREQTGQDRSATAADRDQTAADRVATGEDRAATGVDRTQTGEDRAVTTADRIATSEDRVQTALDRGAAEAKAAEAAASAIYAASAIPIGVEMLWPYAKAIPSGWYDTSDTQLIGTRMRRVISNLYEPIFVFAGGWNGVWFDPSDLTTLFQDSAGSTPVTAAGQPDGRALDKSKGLALGPELLANGDFADASGWTIGTGWTISGGVAQWGAPTGASLSRPLQTPMVAGRSYQVTVDVAYTSGSGAIIGFNGGGGIDNGPTLAAGPVQRKFVVQANLNRTGIGITGIGASILSIDNISVRELPGNHATQPVAAARPTLMQDGSGRLHLYTDPVDDGLVVTVPAGGWTNATVMVALETGLTVLTGQTIPPGAWTLPLPRPSRCYGLVAVNRPLTAAETANLTTYLNQKRGAA